MTHPLLQRAHRHPCRRHRSAKRVPQIVKAMTRLNARSLKRTPVSTHQRTATEHLARSGLGEHEVIRASPPGLQAPGVQLARDPTTQRDAAFLATTLRGVELTEDVATANTNPPCVPVHVLPAQRDQLALPQPGHRRHDVQRTIERLMFARHHGPRKRIDLSDREKANLLACAGGG
jgi:hypothetical protein